MKNFTNLINSLLEAKTLKGAKAQLKTAMGAGHVDLPKTIDKKFLRIVAEENAAFSSNFLTEEEHFNGGHFWVDSKNFHHCDPEEARASIVLQAATARRREGYKDILYFNLLWKTTEEQEDEEARRKDEEVVEAAPVVEEAVVVEEKALSPEEALEKAIAELL